MSTQATDSLDADRRARQIAFIRRIAAGGPAMREGLVGLSADYERNVFSMCMRRWGLTQAEAEEVWQDVLVGICRHAAEFDPDADPAPWILTMVKNRVTDELRGGYRRRRADNDDADGGSDITPGIEPSVPPAHDRTPRLAVDRCVQLGLRDFRRAFPAEGEAIELRDLQEWSIPQVAAFLSRTETATRTYLKTLRKKLAPYLEPCLELLATAEA